MVTGRKLVFVLFLVLIFLSSAFAMPLPSVSSPKDAIGNSIRAASPSGLSTTQNFCLTKGEVIESSDYSEKTGLDSQSIYFDDGALRGREDLVVEYSPANSLVRYVGETKLCVHAKVVCKQTADELDNVLASKSDYNKYEFEISAKEYCDEAMPCCAIVLERGEGGYGGYSSNQSANPLYGQLVLACLFVFLIFIPLMLIVFRKDINKQIILLYLSSIPAILLFIAVVILTVVSILGFLFFLINPNSFGGYDVWQLLIAFILSAMFSFGYIFILIGPFLIFLKGLSYVRSKKLSSAEKLKNIKWISWVQWGLVVFVFIILVLMSSLIMY